MLKLMKYEFRKALTAMMVLLGITAVLEVWFLLSMALEEEGQIVASVILLFLSAYASAVFVFIRGVTTYSGELKNRSSYLIFMTPNSALKIVGSKFVYAFLNALLFVALFGSLALADMRYMFGKYGEWESFIEGIASLLTLNGVPVHEIAVTIGMFVLMTFSELISVIAIAYLAITVGHTLFRDKKWRWLPSLVLFGLMMWGLQELYELLVASPDAYIIYEETVTEYASYYTSTLDSRALSMKVLLPMLGINAATILVSLFGCSAMLERKVSL